MLGSREFRKTHCWSFKNPLNVALTLLCTAQIALRCLAAVNPAAAWNFRWSQREKHQSNDVESVRRLRACGFPDILTAAGQCFQETFSQWGGSKLHMRLLFCCISASGAVQRRGRSMTGWCAGNHLQFVIAASTHRRDHMEHRVPDHCCSHILLVLNFQTIKEMTSWHWCHCLGMCNWVLFALPALGWRCHAAFCPHLWEAGDTSNSPDTCWHHHHSSFWLLTRWRLNVTDCRRSNESDRTGLMFISLFTLMEQNYKITDCLGQMGSAQDSKHLTRFALFHKIL